MQRRDSNFLGFHGLCTMRAISLTFFAGVQKTAKSWSMQRYFDDISSLLELCCCGAQGDLSLPGFNVGWEEGRATLGSQNNSTLRPVQTSAPHSST